LRCGDARPDPVVEVAPPVARVPAPAPERLLPVVLRRLRRRRAA
jgi:hypothetical protein